MNVKCSKNKNVIGIFMEWVGMKCKDQRWKIKVFLYILLFLMRIITLCNDIMHLFLNFSLFTCTRSFIAWHSRDFILASLSTSVRYDTVETSVRRWGVVTSSWALLFTKTTRFRASGEVSPFAPVAINCEKNNLVLVDKFVFLWKIAWYVSLYICLWLMLLMSKSIYSL